LAFRQNFWTFLPHSSTFLLLVLSHGNAWRRLVANVGTSNPDRTVSLELKAAMHKLKIIIIIIIINSYTLRHMS
jgi:hypothetical protein